MYDWWHVVTECCICQYSSIGDLCEWEFDFNMDWSDQALGDLFERTRISMPADKPGSLAPARFRVDLSDLVFDLLYAPLAGAVAFVADRLNRFQYLTIRQYLSLVFGALIALLLVLAVWS